MSDEANQEDKDELIALADASKMYGLSHTYLRTIARNGRLKAKKLGGVWLTTPNDVEAYIRSRNEWGAFRDDIQID